MTSRVQAFDVTIRDRVLRGTHYVPGGPAPFPTAVLYHGFGGQRTEAARAFVQLARAFLARDIAVVAMDRAGHGESDGDFIDTSVSVDVADALEALDAITELGVVNPLDVHLVGISLGAVIASIVAAESHHEIRSVTMWSPAALFVDEIRGGHLQGRPIAEVDDQGYFDFRGMRLGPSFFEDARGFDVYGRARGFHGPVRVLHGDRDFIPARYAEGYADIYGEMMTYTLVEDADHCWESVPARDLVIAETVSFVTGHAAQR
jgi:pimeloyl-ACP methyl ester carboxylesterase